MSHPFLLYKYPEYVAQWGGKSLDYTRAIYDLDFNQETAVFYKCLRQMIKL